MKLRGRKEAPDGAEGAHFLSARGAKPQAHHGPLQRLLAGIAILDNNNKADPDGWNEGQAAEHGNQDVTPRA